MKLLTFTRLVSFKSVVIMLSFFIGYNATAQVTIDESYLTNMYGKKMKEVLYETALDIDEQLEGLILAGGENQVWNFADLNYVDSTEAIFEIVPIPANDPYVLDPNFMDAQMIRKTTFPPVDGGLEDTTFQNIYFSLNDGSWKVHGSVTMVDFDMDMQIDTFVQWFSPASEEIKFPVTYESQFHDSTSLNQIFMGMQFTSAIHLDSNWVDGYGTLITPEGMGDALRVHNKFITRIPGVPGSDVSNSLDFVAPNGISASIVIEDGRAFYSRTTDMSGPVSTMDLPDLSFRLNQNYPNPFTDKTTISFSLERSDHIKINILDMNGTKITQLVNQRYPAGEHELSWIPQDLPTNMYILEMRVGGQIQHRLMAINN